MGKALHTSSTTIITPAWSNWFTGINVNAVVMVASASGGTVATSDCLLAAAICHSSQWSLWSEAGKIK